MNMKEDPIIRMTTPQEGYLPMPFDALIERVDQMVANYRQTAEKAAVYGDRYWQYQADFMQQIADTLEVVAPLLRARDYFRKNPANMTKVVIDGPDGFMIRSASMYSSAEADEVLRHFRLLIERKEVSHD